MLRSAYMSERFGSWDLESLVAVGGLGEIWRATRDDGPPRAIKRLHTHLVRNPEARAQFSQEQRLATDLPGHPSVVRGLEAGEIDGRPYLVLELAPGEDLRRILIPPRVDGAAATVVLPRSRGIAIVRGACAGVAHLHAHGWVHGDINPSNLIVEARRDGDGVVVVDLGVARRIGEAGAVRGTAAYMAPEQVRGGAWTPATDVFALGVVMWELSAGTRLFHRGPTWLSQAAVVEEAAPALRDPALDAVAQAALAKDPARRPRDAAALGLLLAALATAACEPAAPPPTPPAVTRPAHANMAAPPPPDAAVRPACIYAELALDYRALPTTMREQGMASFVSEQVSDLRGDVPPPHAVEMRTQPGTSSVWAVFRGEPLAIERAVCAETLARYRKSGPKIPVIMTDAARVAVDCGPCPAP